MYGKLKLIEEHTFEKHKHNKDYIYNFIKKHNLLDSCLEKFITTHTRILKYIDNQTPEMCLMAMRCNGDALEFVHEQTPEICLAAVEYKENEDNSYYAYNAMALHNVINQTPKICLAEVCTIIIILQNLTIHQKVS